MIFHFWLIVGGHWTAQWLIWGLTIGDVSLGEIWWLGIWTLPLMRESTSALLLTHWEPFSAGEQPFSLHVSSEKLKIFFSYSVAFTSHCFIFHNFADLNFKTQTRSAVSVREGQGVVLLCGTPIYAGGKTSFPVFHWVLLAIYFL